LISVLLSGKGIAYRERNSPTRICWQSVQCIEYDDALQILRVWDLRSVFRFSNVLIPVQLFCPALLQLMMDQKPKSRAVMLQGTGSDVGKTVLVAGLCRLATRQGMSVRPFKPQNMSNNAAVADLPLKMGREGKSAVPNGCRLWHAGCRHPFT
jgi:hypothetical protein